MTWRTIDSAPVDGTHVLGYGLWAGEINGIDAEPTMAVIYKWSDNSDYEGFIWSVHGTDAYAAWMKPTHWQPIEPPWLVAP